MGLTYDGARFLCALKGAGVSFDNTLTLGRQNLMIDQQEASAIEREFSFVKDSDLGENEYAETFVKSVLDADEVDAIDATSYENAKHIADMNQRLPDRFDQTYDVVFDGGTLEHVFHMTTALSNAMRMVKEGGWFVSHTLGNGFMGHGFYQFSPELFFRCFREQSGFSAPIVIAQSFPTSNLAALHGGSWYLVTDPESIGSRVMFSSHRPLSLYIAAQKIKHLPEPFATIPQQSDYESAWNDPSKSEDRARKREIFQKMSSVPVVGGLVANVANRWRMFSKRSLRNRNFFVPISTSELIDKLAAA